MRLNTREAIIGIITYRVLRYYIKQRVFGKGGLMASKKKIGFIAAIGAAVAGLMFWRKKKSSQPSEF